VAFPFLVHVAACVAAGVTIGVLESVQGKDDPASPWRSRLRARFDRWGRNTAQSLSESVSWMGESGTGLRGEALLHSERGEMMRLGLPRL
jgi:hypothetical protein